MEENSFKEIFRRYSKNPLITVKNLPYKANSVFNAGASIVENEILLLMRVEDRRGISHLTIARSRDGKNNWKIDSRPFIEPDPKNYPEEIWGIEDPRITYIEEKKLWGITYTSFSQFGPLVSLATTKDFVNFKRHGIILPPENKDAAIFPIKFDNKWAMIHRPVPKMKGIGAHIWIAFSPDLKHWGEHQLLIPAREGSWWDANKIGIATPPLLTEKGWLILYHGVKNIVGGVIYRLGLGLLDLEDPKKLIARSNEWIFSPETSYEMIGDVNKVVFPCGWILKEEEVLLYYGSADSCIALATAKLSNILEWLKDQDSLQRG